MRGCFFRIFSPYQKSAIMKVILLLLLPFCAVSQRDFDYTFFTQHARFQGIFNKKDSTGLELLLPRMIRKEGNTFRIISCTNTGDEQTLTTEFIGAEFPEGQEDYLLVYHILSAPDYHRKDGTPVPQVIRFNPRELSLRINEWTVYY